MIDHIFPQKIYHKNINKDDTFHTKILEEAKRTMDFSISKEKSMDINYKGYISEQKRYWANSPTYGREYNNPAFDEVHNFIKTCAAEYAEYLDIETSYLKLKMGNSFLNFGNSTGSSVHDHSGAFISFTYYFHIQGNDYIPSLWFFNPLLDGPTSVFPWNSLVYKNHTQYEVKPKIGDCYVWPSYLLHGNDLSKSKYERWLFNGDFFLHSDVIPNFPPLSVD